eukprot:TRINITY_DN19541_c1319_g1_i1.p1 TRINITY_DN19541_c1319_g1~~TRINITY_DN19541_c1319_g1_i1.p1  ORF type:complete len:124 (-),score=36.55 TRINITY_DN19541_c1319_g1_i1:45-416(-)
MKSKIKTKAKRTNTIKSQKVSMNPLVLNKKKTKDVELRKREEKDSSDKTVKDLVWLLYETRLLNSGFNLERPSSICFRFHKKGKFGIFITEEGYNSTEKVEADDVPVLGEDVGGGGGEMEGVD